MRLGSQSLMENIIAQFWKFVEPQFVNAKLELLRVTHEGTKRVVDLYANLKPGKIYLCFSNYFYEKFENNLPYKLHH